jgi:hypothetical protein
MKIYPVGAELYHADERTDRYEEANGRFSQFGERALLKTGKTFFDPHVTVLMPRSRKGRAIPLLTLEAIYACNGRTLLFTFFYMLLCT